MKFYCTPVRQYLASIKPILLLIALVASTLGNLQATHEMNWSEHVGFDFLTLNDCVEDINFAAADSPIAVGTYRAADSLTTTGLVSTVGSEIVVFEAGTVIILRPGFSAQPTATGSFTASIEACTVVSNDPPSVSFVMPVDGDMFTEGDDLDVEVSASDSDGSIIGVELFFDGASQGVDNMMPYQFMVNNLAVGTYTLRAVATDDDGATSEAIITITVNADLPNIPPSVSFVTPTDGQVFTVGDNLNVQVNASDTDGNVVGVELFYDNISQGVETGPFNWTINNLAEGSHTLVAYATDDDGASAQAMVAITVEVVNNGEPIVTISAPQDGQEFTAGDDLTVTASATDDGSVSNIRLLLNDATIRVIQGDTGTWDASTDPALANLAAGTYKIQVAAVDNQGNIGDKTININVVEPGTPDLSFVTPTDGQIFPNGSNVIVEVAASDSDGSINNVELFLDGVFVRRESIPPYEWGLATQNDPLLANMSPGTYTLEAVATDNQGNTRSDSIVFIVAMNGGGGGGNIAPTVAFVTPTDGQTFTAGDNLNIEATASDSDGTVMGVEFFFDGVSQGTDNTAPYQWSVNNLAVGTYNLEVVATDDGGAMAQETITIIVTAPNGGDPIVTISTPADGANFPVGTDLTVMASATDPDGVKNIRLLLNGVTIRVIQSDMGTWSPANGDSQLANLQAGSYEIKVAAVDNNNNVGETVHNITVGGAATNAIDGRSANISLSKTDWSIYPNPVQSILHLDLSHFMEQNIQLELSDQTGRIVLLRELQASHAATEILVLPQSISAGVYYLTLETETELSTRQVVVK